MVVVVNTEVIPRVTLAAVDSSGIQNEIQDKTTISAEGEYTWTRKYPIFLLIVITARIPLQLPTKYN